MLPDSEIAGQFSMGKTKYWYIILNGLAPHFKSKLREVMRLDIRIQHFWKGLMLIIFLRVLKIHQMD